MASSVFWFEFLLNKDLLLAHLQKEFPEPNATTLLTQFIQNAVKWKDNTDDEDMLEKISRAKKGRVLKKLALRTAAFLSWDLDLLSNLPMNVQYSLMEFATEFGGDSLFMKAVYHRWVLRSSQTILKRNNIQDDPAAEPIMRSLTPESSLLQLNGLLVGDSDRSPISVPTLESFVKDKVEVAFCDKISRDAYNSMIHFDIGIYFFYKSQLQNAKIHFQQHNVDADYSPYLKVTRQKLNGYLRGLGLLASDKKFEDVEPIEPRNVQIAKVVRRCNTEKLKPCLKQDFVVDNACPPLDPAFMDAEELAGDGNNFDMEKRLLEATDMNQIKEILIKLHAASGGSRSFAKLFSSWEIAIPLQNGISNILPGAFQDYVHILIAKSQQLLNIKLFPEARTCLQVAQTELSLHLQSIAPALAPYIFSMTKLGKILEWEVLLVDIFQFYEDWPKQTKHLLSRCTECLMCFKHQSSDINPRAEIIENILMALLNIGEFEHVSNLEQFQQKWPFLEFLSLLAKACTDLVELKDSASSYRELWHAVLPHFSNANSVRRQPLKTGILPNRSLLQWVLDRSRSHWLLQLFISLFARLHNHYTDDMGLQISTECLHIWPNILDDVTTNTDTKSRVSGASKLNAKQIRDVLNSLLRKSVSTEVNWLKCQGDVQLASGNPALAMKCYLEYLALSTDFFEKHSVSHWADNNLFRRMIKCSEIMQAFTQALILCQFLTDVDYSTAFGMAQEKVTTDAGDSLYGFIWDLTILEFLINLHTKRSEFNKRQHAMKIMGLMELNSSNNEEIQREAMHLRKSQFMRTLAKLYIFS